MVTSRQAGWPTVALRVANPLPEARSSPLIDVNPRRTNVEITTQPGGFGEARIGLLHPDAEPPTVYPALPEPIDAQDKSHIEVWVGGHLAHAGMAQFIAADRSGIESMGYGIVAPAWGGFDKVSGETALTGGPLLLEALKTVPWLAVGQVDDTGASHLWREFSYRSLADVLSALTEEGGDEASVPWLYMVYEDRRVRFVPKLPPLVCDYRIPYDAARMPGVGFDVSGIVDAARMRYRDGSGRELVTPWQYRLGVDPTSSYLRRRTLSGSAESGSAAAQLIATFLAEHSAPKLRGTLRFGPGEGLQLPSGLERPAYLARYGEWVELLGYGKVIITRTASNLSTWQTRVTLDEPPSASFVALLDRLVRAATALQEKVDPTTGSAWRF